MIAACLKLIDRRPEIVPLTADVHLNARTSGPSAADLAALEWAIRIGEATRAEVIAVTAGPPAADAMLREALAAGATHALRVDLPTRAPSESMAARMARALPPSVDIIVCGDGSLDRGSGAVPAFLAAHREAAQALGLVTLTVDGSAILAERRLDGGRRERLRVVPPAVLSVEGSSARLRRASVKGVVRARQATISVVSGPLSAHRQQPARTGPYRPRARVLPPPTGTDPRQRILSLTGALVRRDPPQRLVLDPAAAAERLLDQLQRWGYLEGSS
jgi:electron transfer flavoprotein beta subunit